MAERLHKRILSLLYTQPDGVYIDLIPAFPEVDYKVIYGVCLELQKAGLIKLKYPSGGATVFHDSGVVARAPIPKQFIKARLSILGIDHVSELKESGNLPGINISGSNVNIGNTIHGGVDQSSSKSEAVIAPAKAETSTIKKIVIGVVVGLIVALIVYLVGIN